MSRKLLIVIIAAAALLNMGCQSKGEKAAAPKSTKIPNVAVAAVTTRDMEEKIVLSGLVSSYQEVLVTAETAGVVERIPVKKGARVRKGDLLAEIDRKNAKANLDQVGAAQRQVKCAQEEADLGVRRAASQAETARIGVQQSRLALAAAEKNLEKVEVALANQRKQFERMENLYAEKLVAQSVYDDAQSALKAFESDQSAARTGVENARETIGLAEAGQTAAALGQESAKLRVRTVQAELESSEAALTQARLRYDKGLVTAPFDGAVDDLFGDEGEYVKLEAPVARLMSTDPILAKVSLAEQDIPFVKTGDPAVVTVSSLAGSSFDGRVSFVGLSADTRTNTFPVEIRVPNPAGELKAGMVAQVTLRRRRLAGAVSVPTFAVVPKEDGNVVFVMENGRATRRKVVTGMLENGWIQVTGLKEGEQLIVKGHRDLQDGQEVRVQP